jgi:hypothetical protein
MTPSPLLLQLNQVLKTTLKRTLAHQNGPDAHKDAAADKNQQE